MADGRGQRAEGGEQTAEDREATPWIDPMDYPVLDEANDYIELLRRTTRKPGVIVIGSPTQLDALRVWIEDSGLSDPFVWLLLTESAPWSNEIPSVADAFDLAAEDLPRLIKIAPGEGIEQRSMPVAKTIRDEARLEAALKLIQPAPETLE